MGLFLIIFGASALGVGGITAIILKKRKKSTTLQPHPAGRPVAWSQQHLPLLVVTDSPDSRANNIVTRCCDEWNKAIEDARVGIKGRMFVASGYTTDTEPFHRPSPGVIPIRFVRDMNEHPHAQLIVNDRGEIRASAIIASLDFSDSILKQVIKHELGHSIGLPHSNDISSIMYPRATAVSTKITQAEIDMLRRLYG